MPLKDSVNLGFYRGAILPDKKKLLKGTGKLMRHLKIKSISDYQLEDITNLITEAKEERLGYKKINIKALQKLKYIRLFRLITYQQKIS